MHSHFSLFLLTFFILHPFIHAFKQSEYEILDLYQTSQGKFISEANSWSSTTSYPNSFITTCDGTLLLSGEGIPQSAGPFRRKYENLPEHKSIIISYEVWLIDPAGTVSGTLSYGTGSTPIENTVTTFSSTTTDQAFLTASKCGTSLNDLTGMTVIQSFGHDDPVLYIEIQHLGGQVGFRNIRIIIAEDDLNGEGNCAVSDPINSISSSYQCDCPIGNFFSSSSICEKCNSACLTCFDDDAESCFSCSDGYYYDGNSCLVCHSSCKTCFGPGINQCLVCPSGNNPNENSQCTATAVQNIINIRASTQTAVSAGLVASSVLGAGGSGAVRVSIANKMIQYIKYLDINYPANLEVALRSSNDDFLNFGVDNYYSNFGNLPSKLTSDGSEFNSVPSALTNYDPIDPNFMANFWSQLKILLIVAGGVAFVWILEWIFNKKKPKSFLAKYSRKLRINLLGLLLNYIYNDAADIFFFAVIDYRATKEKTLSSILNLIISIILIFGVIALLTSHFWLVKKYQKIKGIKESIENFEEKHKGMQVLWKDFKEISLIHMGYLGFAIIRDILFCLLLTLLFEYPFIQAILIVIMSTIMFFYLCLLRPIDDSNDLIQTISCEGILYAVNICLLILARSGHNQTLKNDIGFIMIMLTLLFNLIPLLFLVINLFGALKAAYYYYKSYKLKKLQNQVKNNQVVPFEPIKDETNNVASPNTTRDLLSPISHSGKFPLRSFIKSKFDKQFKIDEVNEQAKENEETGFHVVEFNQDEKLEKKISLNKFDF